jgi:hypothetical protein
VGRKVKLLRPMQKCFRDDTREHSDGAKTAKQAYPFFDRVRDVTRSLTGSLLFIYLFIYSFVRSFTYFVLVFGFVSSLPDSVFFVYFVM